MFNPKKYFLVKNQIKTESTNICKSIKKKQESFLPQPALIEFLFRENRRTKSMNPTLRSIQSIYIDKRLLSAKSKSNNPEEAGFGFFSYFTPLVNTAAKIAGFFVCP